MDTIYYIGLDVHKKSVSYCVKRADGSVVEEGRVVAERQILRRWAEARSTPWRGAMEATLFSGWIYDTLKPYAQQLEMAHPAMLKAIGAAKKKSAGSMPARSPTCCVATCFRSATWPRR